MDLPSKTIEWNDVSIPMKESASPPAESFHIEDPNGVDEIVGRLARNTYQKILQAKNKKADLVKEVRTNSLQLNSQQQKDLITL